MKDMEAVRFNEKVKRISTLAGAVGVTTILTGFTHWSDRGFDLQVVAWIFVSAVATFSSVGINDLIVSEDLE